MVVVRTAGAMDYYHTAVNHRLRGHHRTGFQEPDSNQLEGETAPEGRRVARFVAGGVEKRDDHQGLLYGSGATYSTGRRLDSRSSLEKMKHQRQVREAEADIMAYRERKEKEEREKLFQQRKDLEMLQQYQPWGRPAAGAPRQSHSGTLHTRRMQFGFDSTSSTRTSSRGREAEGDYYPFGRPGAGAPCRTESGNIITGFAADPDMRFQKQLRREVEHSLRYKRDGPPEPPIHVPPSLPPPVTPELEQRAREREKKQQYAQKLEEQRLEAVERRIIEKKDQKAPPPVYDPWGRDQPIRDDSGKIAGRKRAITSTGPVQEGGEGQGLLDHNWREGGRRRRVEREVERKEHISAPGYDPWGKPGAGAPLTSTSGHVVAAVFGNFGGKKEGQEFSLEEDKAKDKGQGVSVASWMRRSREGQPGRAPVEDTPYYTPGQNGSEPRSPRNKLQEERDAREHARKKAYYSDLQKMMQDQREAVRQEKMKEVERERQHARAYDEVWGRPGGGAPRRTASGVLNTSPQNYSTLLTATTHTGQHQFRGP